MLQIVQILCEMYITRKQIKTKIAVKDREWSTREKYIILSEVKKNTGKNYIKELYRKDAKMTDSFK